MKNTIIAALAALTISTTASATDISDLIDRQGFATESFELIGKVASDPNSTPAYTEHVAMSVLFYMIYNLGNDFAKHMVGYCKEGYDKETFIKDDKSYHVYMGSCFAGAIEASVDRDMKALGAKF